MNQDRFAELEAHEKAMIEKMGLHSQLATPPGKEPLVELSDDISILRIFIAEAVTKIEAGGKSRPRSLAITKLQEASFWLNEEIRLS
jgi:hypothetical protein